MYQRHICPSLGAMRRPLSYDVAAIWPNCSTRSLHLSARRYEDNSTSSSFANSAQPQRETRRTRQNAAIRQVTGLQQRRPLPTSAIPNAQHRPNQQGNNSTESTTTISPSRPLVRRVSEDNNLSSPRMVRAPASLRIARNANTPGVRGPNLRGRGNADPRENRSVGRGSEPGPKRRGRKSANGSARTNESGQSRRVEDDLSDGMVQQLLRLQRKEWDKKPYEPKYAHGSPAALELIEAGKKLFEGEVPTVKKPGKLERVLGIVGMHGA